ncbi:MAG: RNA polymerase sigma factor [Saprospiraceae bacterium]|nr:RNA polymerase sigma factor [Saprospiraceae bacterium]MCB9320767.1 RNA polymerase sigma factor [Lewinellaceae bacterium]
MDVSIDLKYEEEDFIKACADKERWAQQKLYEDHYGTMMGVCLRYANNEDEALDILHDAFIKIFRSIGDYKPGTSLQAWMRRIMVNTSIDYYRKQTRRRTEDLDNAFGVQSYDPNALSLCAAEDIIACIQMLTPAYRSVFNLYVIEGYSHKEIADILNITESTSRSNLVKARIKLKELLSEYKQPPL